MLDLIIIVLKTGLCLDQTPLLDWKVVDSLQHLLNSCGVLMKRSAATDVSYRNIVYYINPCHYGSFDPVSICYPGVHTKIVAIPKN